ncbi:hypothetical protein HA050_04120 [Iodobacter sp. HSC-16F04]|uniref:Uncharacterized protein n=1 Tax=Iodobacter violaceini TaxID=3044271 RepID=A0ABX0KS71_9NEIS|nr:major capsid protein [Iodobacter violacea]NHQ85297.1 hypothetical protein [Iodobacter violacea]
MNNFFKRASRVVLVVAGTVVTAPAFAAVDITAAIAELGEAQKAVGLIGIAALSIAVGIKVFKWAQKAL